MTKEKIRLRKFHKTAKYNKSQLEMTACSTIRTVGNKAHFKLGFIKTGE
jgi:hypothetical protein